MAPWSARPQSEIVLSALSFARRTIDDSFDFKCCNSFSICQVPWMASIFIAALWLCPLLDALIHFSNYSVKRMNRLAFVISVISISCIFISPTRYVSDIIHVPAKPPRTESRGSQKIARIGSFQQLAYLGVLMRRSIYVDLIERRPFFGMLSMPCVQLVVPCIEFSHIVQDAIQLQVCYIAWRLWAVHSAHAHMPRGNSFELLPIESEWKRRRFRTMLELSSSCRP